MAKKKHYSVDIELDTVSFNVVAKNQAEARKIAIERLDRKKPSSMIGKQYPSKRRKIWIDER